MSEYRCMICGRSGRSGQETISEWAVRGRPEDNREGREWMRRPRGLRYSSTGSKRHSSHHHDRLSPLPSPSRVQQERSPASSPVQPGCRPVRYRQSWTCHCPAHHPSTHPFIHAEGRAVSLSRPFTHASPPSRRDGQSGTVSVTSSSSSPR